MFMPEAQSVHHFVLDIPEFSQASVSEINGLSASDSSDVRQTNEVVVAVSDQVQVVGEFASLQGVFLKMSYFEVKTVI